METSLEAIRVDDLVAIKNPHSFLHGGCPKVDFNLFKVTHRTTKQARITRVTAPGQELSIRLSDGKVLGESYARVFCVTPEMAAEHKEQLQQLKRWRKAVNRLGKLYDSSPHIRKLSTEQMEYLADAWEKVQAMAPIDSKKGSP